MTTSLPHFALWSLSVALVAALSAPGSALACSCAIGSTDFLAPADGSTEVPTNTRIWVGGMHIGGAPQSAEELTTSPPVILQKDDGTEVDLTAGVIAGNNEVIGVFTPTVELAPGGVYSLVREIYSSNDPDPIFETLTTFTVGAEADNEFPAVPSELARSSSSSPRVPGQVSSCGPTDMVEVRVEATGQLMVGQTGDEFEFDPAELNGSVSEVSFDGELDLGVGNCQWSWPDAKPNASTELRWGAFDLAGNFSGWTEPTEITIPPAGCSCTAQGGGTPSGALAIFAFVALAGWGRRRTGSRS